MKAVKRKPLLAKVISNKMNKSIVVTITSMISDAKYGKYLKRRTNIAVHDESNLAKLGDLVLIQEGRPVSKNKSWHLIEVVESA